MKINLSRKENNNLNKNEVNIEMQHSRDNTDLYGLIDYINNYSGKKVIVNDSYELLEIEYKDIIKFYSDKKYNYCKTESKQYKIKSKLYEIEKMDADFMRISKNCIVNINHIEKFDISETGKIIIKLDDCTEELVSRRKINEVMDFLEERSI